MEEIEKTCDMEKEKIVLYTLTQYEVGQECWLNEFYAIDMRKGQVTRFPCQLVDDSGFSTMAFLGSVIYVVGGLRDDLSSFKTKPLAHSHSGHIHHKHMSYFDLDNEKGDGKWKEGPCPGDHPTSFPALLVLGGKIYLFHRRKSSLAHVFDPLSNKWETLLPPPGVPEFSLLCRESAQVDSQNNRIIVHFGGSRSLFAYCPASNQWELLLNQINWGSKYIFANGVLFFYLEDHPKFLMAYEVYTEQWLNIVFTSDFSEDVRNCDLDALFHLGGNLMCFAVYSDEDSPPQTRVYLFKFRFERSAHSPADLLITVLPEEDYIIGPSARIKSFFPI